MRGREGYVGFIEELPNVNCHAHSLDEARSSLRSMVAVVFEEERRNSSELTTGKELVRESFTVPVPRASARTWKEKPRMAGLLPQRGPL